MNFEIKEEPISSLHLLSAVSIAYTVEGVLELEPIENGLVGLVLKERELETPYTKDYDAIEREGPARWAGRFDVTNWGLLLAKSGERTVGGAVIAFDTEGVHMLEGRRDLAVLWDLRVDADFRRKGIGSALFEASEHWALSRNCHELKVETQNINVDACRFYQKTMLFPRRNQPIRLH